MPTTMVIVACNGGREVSMMLSRVKDAVAKADDSSHIWISRASREANNFTTYTDLLCRKHEGGESGGSDVSISSKETVEATIADLKEKRNLKTPRIDIMNDHSVTIQIMTEWSLIIYIISIKKAAWTSHSQKGVDSLGESIYSPG
jgi:hypothetical protein